MLFKQETVTSLWVTIYDVADLTIEVEVVIAGKLCLTKSNKPVKIEFDNVVVTAFKTKEGVQTRPIKADGIWLYLDRIVFHNYSDQLHSALANKAQSNRQKGISW